MLCGAFCATKVQEICICVSTSTQHQRAHFRLDQGLAAAFNVRRSKKEGYFGKWKEEGLGNVDFGTLGYFESTNRLMFSPSWNIRRERNQTQMY